MIYPEIINFQNTVIITPTFKVTTCINYAYGLKKSDLMCSSDINTSINI